MATYVNDLRLKEIATGDESGTWGTSTNTNLELIGEALGYATEAITTNADTHTTTVADGSTDPGRAMYIKYTGALDSDCTITIGPNTMSRVHFIENATTDSGSSGPYNIIISQGSGANVTIPNGYVKAVYLDGAGSGAAVTEAFTDLSVGSKLLIDGATPTLTIGDAGAEDTKIVFDGNAQDFYIGLDDSADDLVFGKGSALGTTQAMAIDENMDVAFGPTTNVTITNDGNEDTLKLVSTDTDANAGPILKLDRPVTGADDDLLGGITFSGYDDGNNAVDYGGIQAHLKDASDTAEDGLLDFQVMSAGTSRSFLILNGGGTAIINQDSQDIDTRIESNDNTHMLFVDAGNDVVNVGADTVETGDQFSIHGSGTNTTMRMYNTNTGSDGGLFIFQKNSSSPADGDILGDIRFHGNDDGGGMTQFGRIKGKSQDVSNGAEDGKIEFEVVKAGTTREFMHLGPDDIIFNDDSEDIDLRIESADTTHMVFFDAGGNSFNIDDSGVAGVRSTINKNSSGARVVSTGSYNNIIKVKNGNTTNTIDRDATITWQVGGADEGYMSWVHSDGTSSTNFGRFEFAGRNAGQRALMATFTPNVESVFNEGSLANQNFRIESDSYTHMWFLDSGDNFTHWGNNSCNMTTNGWCIGATGFAHSVFSLTTTNEAFLWNNNNATGATYKIAFRQNNGEVGYIGVGSSTTAYNTSSDYRLKTDVKDLENAVDRVNALRPRKFTWIKDGKEEEGFIAHEVQEVYPDAVEGEKDAVDEEGNMKIQVMDYGKITPLLAAGLQEAFKEIESLKQQIAELKGE